MATLEAPMNSNRIYLSIAEGSLREKAHEGTPGAVKREWQAGGESGVKWEKVYKQIRGRIVGVSFFDGEANGRKFTNLNIQFDEIDGKTPVLSVGLKSRYATDILKKLPNVDLSEEVQIRPFSFKPEGEDKEVIGVEIKQQDHTGNFERKIASYFHKKEGEKWVAVNGYPEPTEEDRADWEFFYKKALRFLVEYTKANITPSAPSEVESEGIQYPEEDVKAADIPW